MSTLKENLGKRIQEIRKSKNLTQEKLAEMIGIDTPNLSNIERGKRFLSAETLEKIIKSLDVREKDLFDFEHLKSKDDLINSINTILNESDINEIEYYYRMMNLYRESL